MDIRHQNERKINPDEPWRYECADCGSLSIRRSSAISDWRCQICGDKIDQVVDRKTGEEMPVVSAEFYSNKR